MRSKTLTIVFLILMVAIIVIVLPCGIFFSNHIVAKHQRYNAQNASNIALRVDSLLNRGLPVGEQIFEKALYDNPHKFHYAKIILPDSKILHFGKDISIEDSYVDRNSSVHGALVVVKTKFFKTNAELLLMWTLMFFASGVFMFTTMGITLYFSRKISSSLMYLSAYAEGVGSADITAQLSKTGIEEIDLLQAELSRTAEKIAGRIAVERQFASNVSHQIRTPLTALSMRIEEIEMLTDDEYIRTEANLCIEQIERLTQVVQDLLFIAKNRNNINQEAIFLFEIFDQQHKEWDFSFRKAKRDLIVIDETNTAVSVTKGYISQVLATLIENSLKYGAGTTTVNAYMSENKAAIIEVTDEGEGVDKKIADRIFEKHFSGKGSSGLGLAIAKDLVEADGGRIELVQLSPPIFRISLTTISPNYVAKKSKNNNVMIGVSRRQRNLS